MKKPLKIAHISDIHIFHSKRHQEHREVIDNLILKLLEEKPDLIYIGGDIQDSKSKLSPEQIELVNYLIYELSSLCPVIVILGNHDTNLQNRQRLDSLTPLLNNINSLHPIYYLKYSGVYHLYDIDWVVWSRLDNEDPMKDFTKKKYTIGCYHGPIEGIKLDSGYSNLHAEHSVDTFNQCDSVFLGDIHLQQFFRNNDIAYSGSLLQVTMAESEDKGILIWDWDKKEEKYKPRHVNIPNRFGYKTIVIDDLEKFKPSDVVLASEEQICRLVYTGDESTYSFTKFNEIKKEIKGSFGNQILLQKKFSKRKVVSKNKETVSTNFFEDYFKNKGLSKELIEDLKALDNFYNSGLTLNEYQGSEYYLKEIEISNFLCYGEDNVIDFEEIKGLTGLFAKNGTGKTSFFDAIMFCLFNRTPKDTEKSVDLINDQTDALIGFVQIKLVLAGILWTIKRSIVAKKDKSGASIKLEVYEEGIARHMESRPQTDKNVLQPLLGDENIFLMTVLSSQKDNIEFIKTENAKRLDLIIKFLGILLYDAKLRLCTDTLKQEEIIRGVLNTELEKLTSLQELTKEKTTIEEDIVAKEKEVEELKKEIDIDTESLKTLTTERNVLSVIGVTESETTLTFRKKTNETSLESERNKLTPKEVILADLKTKVPKWTEAISIDKWQWEGVDQKKLELIADLKAATKTLRTQIDDDVMYKCPSCSHTWHTTNKVDLEKNLAKKEKELKFYNAQVQAFLSKKNFLRDLKTKITNINLQIANLTVEITTHTQNIKTYEKNITEAKAGLKIIEDNKETIRRSEELDLKIEDLNTKLETNRDTRSSTETLVAVKKEQLITNAEKITSYTQKIEELEVKDRLINNLNLYKGAMHRSGIPTMILQNFIPLINHEVNSYINEMFDFSVEFELDESSLKVYYTKEGLTKTVRRNIALACGMESTIVNLAIRAALTKISLLPKPSLLLLDEMFSMLDEENLGKMYELVLKLKEQYQNIILITHTDEIKEWPENFITLSNHAGITSIINE